MRKDAHEVAVQELWRILPRCSGGDAGLRILYSRLYPEPRPPADRRLLAGRAEFLPRNDTMRLNRRPSAHYKGCMTPSIPFPQSYWVEPQMLCAGHYPGDRSAEVRRTKLEGLVRCGIRRVINLIPDGETGRNGESFLPYQTELQELARERGWAIDCLRMGFPDGKVPTVEQMIALLDAIDASIEDRHPVYVHCWGGHGRTSTVIGCHLVRHGSTPKAAIERILAWRTNLPRNWFPFQKDQQAFLEAWVATQ